jgi:hypothetical protein
MTKLSLKFKKNHARIVKRPALLHNCNTIISVPVNININKYNLLISVLRASLHRKDHVIHAGNIISKTHTKILAYPKAARKPLTKKTAKIRGGR